ncbi:hypothetical protein M408DRAFT_330655 [Serendipita vermifera MAFF 305830]|uniref:Choline/carnitine acyltransferase domain-containing protein n=1 Tax=Serendipita vermifera MAFF 305830 TaxID=933852 RepID=A0A0C2XAQ7_SERVB|nr:hypothetical protein M408DRAFT_330655 [Serendipita vermifera MAFF 305830]
MPPVLTASSLLRPSIAPTFRGQRLRNKTGMLFALLHTQPNTSLPTFHHQSALPKLPVPPLRQTLEKYIQSLEPFLLLESQNGNQDIDQERARRVEWARNFETGVGLHCQQRLQELAARSPYNWLDDNFWLRKAYLENRAPLLVHSNWWLALQDDLSVPDSIRLFSRPEPFNIWQLRRAAWTVKRMLEYKQLLDTESIPPDMIRGVPLCMSHYKRMFNMTRIPQENMDRLHKASSSNPAARRITVLVRNHMFSVDVYDEKGSFIGVNAMTERLRECTAQAQQSKPATSIPILTADDRQTWAKNREYLANLSPVNQMNLLEIDSSLFCLSLDGITSRLQEQAAHSQLDELTNPRWDDHLHNTAYGQRGHNRWFDKTVTMSVESNTRLGMMGEHSPCDALIPSILGDFCVKEPMAIEEFQTSPTQSSSGPGWRQLAWTIDSHIKRECQRVDVQCRQLIEDSDDSQLWFEDFGVDLMRSAKLSPDAFIQMALQLAWNLDQGKVTAVYETGSTRLFLHGRTEVIRSLSTQSLQWVQAMNDPNERQSTRLRLLIAAIKEHNMKTRDASTGAGIDRHLMALRLVMQPGETAELFEDSLFGSSQEWKLSTSGLSAGDRFIGTGFGCPYPDGYGINYLAGARILKFGIESKRSCATTSTRAFKMALVNSLQRMRETCEEGYAEMTANGSQEELVQSRL